MVCPLRSGASRNRPAHLDPAIGHDQARVASGRKILITVLQSPDAGYPLAGLGLCSPVRRGPLADVQALLRTRSPSSAVDRIHTGLHALLKGACNSLNITYANDASANQLLKLLLHHHPRLADLGPRSNDIRKLIRTSSSIVDTLGTLRNQARLAHPNAEALGREQAQLAINLARSLLRFLDSKVSDEAK